MLTDIAFSNIRNLSEQQFTLASGINLVTGDNAAGKTSLLETLYLLSVGRSFRTSKLDHLIADPSCGSWVRGHIKDTRSNIDAIIGFQRIKKRNQVRINGVDGKGVSDLAKVYPVQVIHPESHKLITAGPSVRRAFIDWGCFYLYSDFYEAWRDYRRILFQYNAALKNNVTHRVLESLEYELCQSSQKIDAYRKAYIETLANTLSVTCELWPDAVVGHLEYVSGWPSMSTLKESLEKYRERSIRAGASLVGPHRADLHIYSRSCLATAILSRGQIKRVTIALILAQTELYERTCEKDCMLLIDDIASELDRMSLEIASDVIQNRSGQSLVTALDASSVNQLKINCHKMFHVKHGQLHELV